jgi:rhamnose transport system permease protein
VRAPAIRREAALAAVVALLCVAMSNLSPYFWDRDNLLDLSRHLAEAGIIACGMTLVIMTGGIDLSVGSLLGLAGIALGYGWKAGGPVAGALACAATGLAGGALNGGLVSLFRLPPLVVTLATMALFRGAAMVVSQAQPVSDFPSWFAWLGQGDLAGVPVQLAAWIALVGATTLLIERMPAGRHIVAVGDSERAAEFAALPVRAVRFGVYCATGFLCALAAAVFTSRVSTAKADAGLGLELEVITAVVLGGTAITGGRGSALGSMLGVIILGVLRNGLSLRDVPSVYQTILAGVILIATAIVNQKMLERRDRGTARRADAPGGVHDGGTESTTEEH